jgi:peptide/nickel transport system substrate-binding protein/oligopeptide transport system substrate-binding protein
MRRKKRLGGVQGAAAARIALRWLAVPALLALLLTACSTSQSRTAATPTPALAANQTLRAALVTGQGTPALQLSALDPAGAPAIAEREVASLLFDGLVTTDAHLGVEPWGASNIAVSSDGRTYTFTLRDGQQFSDGTPVTASDYAFSLDRMLNPCVASPNAYYLFDIKNATAYFAEMCHDGTISVPPAQQGPPPALVTTLVGTSIVPDDDSNMLTITLAHPSGYFLQSLASSASYVLDPALVGKIGSSTNWVSHLSEGATGRGASGMYYLAGTSGGGSQVTLKLNPHWWGIAANKRPHLGEIDFTLFGTAAQSQAAYTSGKVDVAYLPPTQPAQATTTPTPIQPDTHTVPLLETYALGMNWTMPPMDNADAREALCLALDRGAVLRQVSAADSTIQGTPSWHLIPTGMPGYNPALTGPDGVTSADGDPNAARAHWQKYVQSLGGAAAPDIVFLSAQGAPWQVALGTALLTQWQAVLGLSISLNTVPANTLQDSTSGVSSGAAHSDRWQGDLADPQDALSTHYLPGALENVAGVNDPAATALLQNADGQPDPTVRIEEYQQAEQLLVREAATCPLWQTSESYQVRMWVRGWSLTSLGLPANDTWLATAVVQH